MGRYFTWGITFIYIDKVSPFVLNKCSKEWSIPLNLLFNSSMPENYRPVSLTSVPCKIMEKLVKKAIVNHLEANDLISKHQHGFVNKKSCVTNLLECLDYSTKTMSEKNFIDIILLDFAKAFDKVPHRRLLKKIENYGINGRLLLWIKAFLGSRRQRVILGETTSNWTQVLSGVPQGSVLGPVLFILYINDLPETMTNKNSIYADDTKILGKIRSDHVQEDSSSLQNDIDTTVKWTDKWLMRLNPEKCKVIHIGKKNSINAYFMSNYATGEPSLLKYLYRKETWVSNSPTTLSSTNKPTSA